MGSLRHHVGNAFAWVRRSAGITALACACVVGAASGVMSPVAQARPVLAAPAYDYFQVQKDIWTTLFASDWKEDAEYALDKRVEGAGEYAGVNENGEAFTFKSVGALPVKIDGLDLTPAEKAWATQNQVTFAAVIGVIYTENGAVAIHGLAGTAKTAADGFQSRLLINNVLPPDSAVFGTGFGNQMNAAASGEVTDVKQAPPTVDPDCAIACVNAYNAAVAAANAAWQQAMNNANQQFQDAIDFAQTDFNLCISEAAARYTARALRCMIPRIRIWKIGRCLEDAATDYANDVTICSTTFDNRVAAAQRALNQQITAINAARQRAIDAARANLQACLNGCIVVPAQP